MKKRIALILIVVMMMVVSGCEVSHNTKIDSRTIESSIEKISELGVR